jgi:hypothetical protein
LFDGIFSWEMDQKKRKDAAAAAAADDGRTDKGPRCGRFG